MSYGYGSIWGGTKEDNRRNLYVFLVAVVIGLFLARGCASSCIQDAAKMQVVQPTQIKVINQDKPISSGQWSLKNQHNPFMLGDLMFQAMYSEYTFKMRNTMQVVYDPETHFYSLVLVPKFTANNYSQDIRVAVTGNRYYDSLEVETRSSQDSYKSGDIEYPSLDLVFSRKE